MNWPDPCDVVMVSDEDVPEQAERFALALVLDSERLTWYELMAAAEVAAADDADVLEWSVSHEFNSGNDRPAGTESHPSIAVRRRADIAGDA